MPWHVLRLESDLQGLVTVAARKFVDELLLTMDLSWPISSFCSAHLCCQDSSSFCSRVWSPTTARFWSAICPCCEWMIDATLA